MPYELTVGLEVHAELRTESKMFCSCGTGYGAPPNSQVCPICLGMPGMLPVLNREAVRLGVLAGLATNCNISQWSRFDRKSYFYPDLPKGYQITQYDEPLCRDGWIDVETKQGIHRIRIERIHLEEDAGKLQHGEDGTRIDYNRAGIPLIEIVSRPDIRSAEEAKAYLYALRERLIFAGVSDCKMNEGSMRCDVNLSVRPVGQTELGVAVEIKNLNSIAFVGRAIAYEFERQTEVLAAGGTVRKETRRYDENSDRTSVMRVKETAADYRYLPEADLPAILLCAEELQRLQNELPTLPDAYRAAWRERYGTTADDARLLSENPYRAQYFSAAAAGTNYPKIASNFIIGTLLPLYGENEIPLPASSLAAIADMVGEKRISTASARRLAVLCADGSDPEERARAENMFPITDRETLARMVQFAMTENPQAVQQILAGKEKAGQALIGSVMRQSGGRADVMILQEVLRNALSALTESETADGSV